MKKMLFSYGILICLVLSCAKEELIVPTTISESTLIEQLQLEKTELQQQFDASVHDAKIEKAYEHLQGKLSKIKGLNGARGGGNLPFGLVGIDPESPIVHIDEEKQVITYTFKMQSKKPKKNFFFNSIITENESGDFIDMRLLRFDLDSEFESQYSSGLKSFGNLRGTMKQFSLEKLLGNSRNDAPCEETYFGGGSGGDHDFNLPSTNSGTTTTPTESQCEYSLIEIPCGCQPSHMPGESCNCSTKPSVVMTIRCNDLSSKSSATSRSFSDCDQIAYEFGINYPQDNDPSDAFNNLDESMYYYLGNNGLTSEQIVAFNALYGEMQQQISNTSWNWPKNSVEWQELAIIMRDELLSLKGFTELFVPGVSDIESALRSYKNGSYWGAAFDVTMAITDFIPHKKIAGSAFAVAVITRKSMKILNRIINLRKLNVSFVNKMPTHWRRNLSKSGEGVKWVNPNNQGDVIRLMPGNGVKPWQKAPYVKRYKNGHPVDKFGNAVDDVSEASHIPWSDYTDFDFN